MSDLECPYCEADLDVCHDDGFGYSEGVAHEMQCYECEKNFVFHTSISFYYEPKKADCLNGSPHRLKIMETSRSTITRCKDCEYEKYEWKAGKND